MNTTETKKRTAAQRYIIALKLAGRRYERAIQACMLPGATHEQWKESIAAEQHVLALLDEQWEKEVWASMWIVHGRNLIRRARKLNEVHV